MKLGKLLRIERLYENRTTKQLAEEIGVSSSTIGRIESGKSCDMRSLGKLITWLIAEDDGKPELFEGHQEPTQKRKAADAEVTL